WSSDVCSSDLGDCHLHRHRLLLEREGAGHLMANIRSNMFDAKDSVIVIGVGRSGLATAEVLRARGVSVVAFDDKPTEKLAKERAQLAKIGVPLLALEELSQAVGAATAAVLSPGVPLNNPTVLAISRTGVPVF